MKAPDFAYRRPTSIREAIALIGEGEDPMLLAGGQSLMPMMNLRMARPDILVDLNRIPELRGIRDDGHIVIGAMTRYSELLASPLVREHLPLFMAALPHVAHPAIRNRGTIGGSVALADPAAEIPALLLALGATVVLQGPSGERRVPADDFFLGIYETAREADEIVVAIHVPKGGGPFGFYELARRHGDYAMAGVAVALSEPRIAFFGVADRAVRAPAAEAVLRGRNHADPRVLDGAIAALDLPFGGDLHTSAETKRHYAGVVLRRALAEPWSELVAA
ncbi:MAG: xanthine dehydrogenase family protein subunit M [Pseudomonadota bacterium]